jgi:hypothetical protein
VSSAAAIPYSSIRPDRDNAVRSDAEDVFSSSPLNMLLVAYCRMLLLDVPQQFERRPTSAWSENKAIYVVASCVSFLKSCGDVPRRLSGGFVLASPPAGAA